MSVRDTNRIPELVQQLKSLNKRKVQLGIVAPSGDKMYMVAWVHEFGIDIQVTPKMRGWFLGQGMPISKNQTKITIPERSYFRSGYDANSSSIGLEADKIVDQLLQGEISAYDARESLGEFAADKVRGNVSNVGLVKTGALRDAIGYRVVLK